MAFILNDVVPWGRNIQFKKDYHVKILPTEYEFQKGANKLLVIKNQEDCVMKCNSLEEVRENIDRIDNEIIKLIAERGTYVVQASAFKKSEDGVKDPNRVEAVIKKVREKALEYGANADMVEALYREMISRFVSMEMDDFKRKH